MAVLSDPIADFLARLKTSSMARKETFTVPYSRIKAEMARILQEEGFIWSYEVDTKSGKFPQILIKNKFDGRTSAIRDLKRVSRPGRRQYIGASEVPKVVKGFGISILSTPKGIMTGVKARRENVGGEYLAQVW